MHMTQKALDFYCQMRGKENVAKIIFVVIFVRFRFDLNIRFNFYKLQDLFIHLY